MIGEEAVDMIYSSVEVNELTRSMLTVMNQKMILNVNYYIQCNGGIHYILIHAGELDSLCCEIEDNLKECQSRQNTSIPSWHQRIERREEAWEVNRKAIFEHVVRKETLPRENVLKI